VISDQARTLAYSRLMTVWLVAEDRVQIIRADSVVSFAVNSVKPSGSEHHNPLERLSWGKLQILAATSATRNVESVWTSLITFDANGQEAVKVLGDLTEVIAKAEQQTASSSGGNQVLFVHGPLPRFSGNPAKDQVWHISEELPVKQWPTSGSYFRDPLP
jgi:hypothetical protein